MSETVSEQQPGWRPRIGTTPLSDLVLGKLTGRLDIDGRLSSYQLPAEVLTRVKLIAKRTKLSKKERADVAVALGEDAALKLHGGLDAAAVIRWLGEPRARGKEIRRERLRARPLVFRLIRGWKRRMMLGLLAMTIVYGVMFARYATGRTQIKRNMCGEMNAPLAHIPEAERAAPVYKRAALAHFGVPQEIQKDFAELRPTDKRWERLVEYVKASKRSAELARTAAALPHLGAKLGDGVDGELAMEPAMRDATKSTASTENPFALEVTLPHLGIFRGLARLLAADARVAAEEGRGADLAADLVAMMGIAKHARESPTLISDLVSIAVVALAADTIRDVIKDHPGLLNDEQLKDIAQVFGGYAEEGIVPLRLSGEQMFIEDFLQRSYTDDGNGDGRPCAEGLRNLRRVQGKNGNLDITDWLLMPMTTGRWAGRKEMLEKWNELSQSASETAAKFPWQRGEPAYEQKFDEIDSDPDLSRKFWVICVMAPAYTKAISSIDQISLTRDGTVVAIALERWRLKHGAWPESLDRTVPEVLDDVPVDRMTGKPLLYKLSASGPLLYSAGIDGDDDGGRELDGQNRFRATHWSPPSRKAAIPDADFMLFPRTRDVPKERDEEGG